MRAAAARHLAFALCGITLILELATIVLLHGNNDGSALSSIVFFIALDVLLALAAIIVSLQADNPIGWTLIATAMLVVVGQAGEEYGVYGLIRHPGAVPLANSVTTLGLWASQVSIVVIATLLPLLFPTGRPPTPRWRPVFYVTLLSVLAFTVGVPLASLGETNSLFERFLSPIGSHATEPIGSVLIGAGIVAAMVAGFASVVSLIVRFRRARGVERQQLKWLCLVVVVVAVILGGLLLIAALGVTYHGVLDRLVWEGLPSAWLVGIVVAIAIALLRHNLYDVDRLINRSIVYGLLTLTLGTIYLLLVLGLENIFRAATGQSSDLVTAASTLAVAALIGPLRSRIQTLVDRRFYRHKYDATRTLEAFSSRLRDQTDLSALATELGAMVQETMQPTHVSLWVCSATGVSKSHLGGQAAR
jgi:hypothetical protein